MKWMLSSAPQEGRTQLNSTLWRVIDNMRWILSVAHHLTSERSSKVRKSNLLLREGFKLRSFQEWRIYGNGMWKSMARSNIDEYRNPNPT